MDITGRWSYNKDRWNCLNPKIENVSNYQYFENSFYFKYLELGQFELFLNKLRLDENEEGLFFMLKAAKHPLNEEKIGFTRLNTITTSQDPNNFTIAIIQNFHKHTNEFQILRLGPNHTCTEYYRFDPNGRIHVILVAHDHRGSKITLTRSFERLEDPGAQQREKIRLLTTAKTSGWNEINTYPAQLMEMIEVKLQKVSRFTDNREESEILFTPSLSNDQKQLIQFTEDFHNHTHIFHFQVISNSSPPFIRLISCLR